jgi:hypothetical protein
MTEDIRKIIDKINNLNENSGGGRIWYHGSKRDSLSFNDRRDDPDYNMMGYGLYLTDSVEEAKYYATKDADNGYIYEITVNGNFLNYDEPIEKNVKQNILNTDPDFYGAFKTEKPDLSFEDDMYEYNDYRISWDFLEDDVAWANKGYFIYDEVNDKMISQGLSKENCFNELQNIINKLPTTHKKELEISDLPFYSTKNTEFLKKDNIFDDMFHLLTYLYIKFGSLTATSKFLVKNGVSGIINKVNTSDYAREATVCVVYDPTKYKIVKRNGIGKNDDFV